MSKAWKNGSTTRWRKIRGWVLDQNRGVNGGRCGLEIPGVCTGEADTVHHVLGRAVTGDDPRYLQAVCRACNLRVGEPGRAGGKPHSPKHKTISKWFDDKE